MQAVLADLATAPVSEPLRAMLGFLRKVTCDHRSLTPDDVRALATVGLSRAQIDDALHVAFAFNVITRLADTFEFHVGPQAAFDASAERLLARGYNL